MRRHDAQITWPYAYYVDLGSRCKMANSSSEDETGTDTDTRETHKDTAVSVWACQAGFWKSTGTSCQLRSKPHAVFHGVCEIALTEVLATHMGVIRRSKKVKKKKIIKKSETSDSFVNHFDGHFAYLKTLDLYFKKLEDFATCIVRCVTVEFP